MLYIFIWVKTITTGRVEERRLWADFLLILFDFHDF